MSFLFPAFLIGAAAAAVPIVLHLFRRQSEHEVRFSAVRFLRKAPVEQAHRRRLRELLLLALRVTALVLLAAAFARPYLATGQGGDAAAVTVIAVDRSFSMSAPGQFSRARQFARDATDAAPADHLVALVAFGDAAEILVPPSADRAAVTTAIDRLQTGYEGTRYAAALARAAEAIGGRNGRIVVVTDLQQSGWLAADRGAVPARVNVEVADAGAPPSNLALIDLRTEREGTVALIGNSGVTLRDSRARLRAAGRLVVETAFTVMPGRSTEVRLAGDLPPRGVASVEIDDDIGYSADNTRYLSLDPPEPTSLLAVTASASTSGDSFYLERALLIGKEASRFAVTSASAGSVSGITLQSLQQHAMVILLGTRGLDRAGSDLLQAYVAGGGGLLVVGGPDLETTVVEDLLTPRLRLKLRPAAASEAPLTFAPVDRRHPILRTFGATVGNLGSVRFTRTVGVADDGVGRVIGRFSNGMPALVEYQVGSGRVVWFGSDLNNRWNDFPLHPTFVPFVHEVARYVTATRAARREYLIGDLPPGLAARPGEARLPDVSSNRPGGARTDRRIVVNVDPRESDPSRLALDRFMAAMTRMHEQAAVEARNQARDQEARQRLWQYGLALMAVGLVVEGLLGSRMG